MKKILLTSIAALFAISAAHAVPLPSGGVVGSTTFNTKIGDLDNLTTSVTTNIVAAINSIKSEVGNLGDLTIVDGNNDPVTNVVDALNILNQTLDTSDKQDKASSVTPGNVALWASDGNGMFQTAGEVAMLTSGDVAGGSNQITSAATGLTTGKAVYEYVDSKIPQYPPQECIDAQTGQLVCVLGQEWDSVNSELLWKWLPLY